MIPPPTASRSVSRATSAESAVDDRASIECLRLHGYASASQIVSNPASSITRACSRISSSGSMVSCMTPTRKDGAGVTRLLAGEGAGDLDAARELAAERSARAVALDDGFHVVGDLRLLALLLDRQEREAIGAVAGCGCGEDERVRERDRVEYRRVLSEADDVGARGLEAHA